MRGCRRSQTLRVRIPMSGEHSALQHPLIFCRYVAIGKTVSSRAKAIAITTELAPTLVRPCWFLSQLPSTPKVHRLCQIFIRFKPTTLRSSVIALAVDHHRLALHQQTKSPRSRIQLCFAPIPSPYFKQRYVGAARVTSKL